MITSGTIRFCTSKTNAWKLGLGSNQKLLRAESTKKCQTWHAVGRSNGPHAFAKFVLISALFRKALVATLSAPAFAANKKIGR